MVRSRWLPLACVLLLAGALLPMGCQNQGAPSGAKIFVDAYPVKYFAEHMGGAHFNVVLPVPAGKSPEEWNPSADEIAQFQTAFLIFRSGAGLSPWMDKASFDPQKLIDTSATYKDKLLEIPEEFGVPHSHGDGVEHRHAGIAPITWLDMTLALAQADAVREALTKAKPEAADEFEERFDEIQAKISTLDQAFKNLGGSLSQYRVVGSHPVFQYFSAAYKLKMEYVHWEPSVVPTAEQLEALKKMEPQLFLWESPPSPEADKAVKDLGITTAVLNTCVSAPSEGDWASVMTANREALKSAMLGLLRQARESEEAEEE